MRPHGSDTELVAVHLETGEERSLFVGPLMEMDVSPDGRGLAEGTWHIHYGGWSWDSKSLVYTQDEDFGDIYELVPER